MSEKPYAATPERLRKARADGDIPKAQEIANVCSFLAVAFTLGCCTASLTQACAGSFLAAITCVKQYSSATPPSIDFLVPSLAIVTQNIIGILLGGVCLGVAIAMSATRGSIHGISCKFDRLSPMPQLKHLFSPATAYALVRSTCSALIAVACLVPSFLNMVSSSVGLRAPLAITAQVWGHVNAAFGVLACVGIAVAALEVLSALRKRSKKLRMSFEELKRESKEQNGDPHIRNLRKRRHRSRMRGGIAAVSKASVVITNPTHIAVALLYAPPETPIPRIVALGADDEAAAIRRAAKESGVPLVEHVALARLLWAKCDEGDVIPIETYAVIAPIIAAAIHTHERHEASQ